MHIGSLVTQLTLEYVLVGTGHTSTQKLPVNNISLMKFIKVS